MELPSLILKKNEERRLRAGHAWVFSNEVDTARTPLTAFTPGQPATLRGSDDRVIGTVYVNPHSLICARLVNRQADTPLDRSLLVHRLKVALGLRERLFPGPYYRVVHGESDALPGLIVDRFGDVLVAQVNTAGIEVLRDEVVEALRKVLNPRGILLRNDTGARELEGLERRIEVAFGEVPDAVEIEENGARFLVQPREGQKTGWFYDHRENRVRMRRFVHGARVLDLFSYTGSWGVQAAVAGAESVACVDSSAHALDRVQENAALNGVEGRVNTIEGDVFDALRALRSEQERFDVVILDPPAFVKRRKDLKEGSAAYRRANQMAMQLLGKDGVIISASCSYHMGRDELRGVMHQAARHIDRRLLLLDQGHQGPDHPIDPGVPETEYLKCFFGRVVLA